MHSINPPSSEEEVFYQLLCYLGKAMGPESFAPYFSGLLPVLIKMSTDKKVTKSERAFAVGVLGDCMEPLQAQLQPYVDQVLKALTIAAEVSWIMQWFLRLCVTILTKIRTEMSSFYLKGLCYVDMISVCGKLAQSLL